MNRVGQVWEFGESDYIGLIVTSQETESGWVHQVIWLVQYHEPGRGELYPCVETAFSCDSSNMLRIV